MQLNIEQKKIINSKPAGHSLVRGVAGSGKTTVAVNRISFLLNHYCIDKDDKILMVTYNKALMNYIRYIYDKIKKEQSEELIGLFNNNATVDIVNIDKIMFRYFKEYCNENNLKYKILNDSSKRRSILQQCILQIKKSYSDVKIMDVSNSSFLNEEIEWMKSCNYVDLETYQQAERLGRMSNKSTENSQRLFRNSRERESIYELMMLYDEKLREINSVEFSDVNLFALEQVKKKVSTKYTHIIVDESQDLSRVQLEFIKCLHNDKEYSSIMFVADTAQSIYSKAWLIKTRSFASIGFDMKGKSNILSKNYRTTTQISECAYSLIESDENIVGDENFVKPSLRDRQGCYPVMASFKDIKCETEYVVKIINGLMKKVDKSSIFKVKKLYEYNDIAIIARTKNQLVEIEKLLSLNKVPNRYINGSDEIDFAENTVKLLTMHSIKGLEFKVVIVMGLSDKSMPNPNAMSFVEDNDFYESMERKLLYVGMTRATERLYMTYSGMPSKFIGDINSKFLKVNDDTQFRRFYSIPIDEYVMKEKIHDIYSNEEKVRQWFIKELKETYKYPDELINIEEEVNIFSARGLVDIVISTYDSNRKIPYIYIEIKKSGVSLDDAMQQLKSYMSVSKQCKYGVVTDGNEIRIVDDKFNDVGDMPYFQHNMMCSSIERFEYVDLVHNKSCELLRDYDSIDQVTINNDGYEQAYNLLDLSRLNIYSDIAAGNPIFINDEIQDTFYIPKCLVRDEFNSFIVKVKGDSMIEANINSGDYVVIKKQSTAETREIAAVDIDGNATLKRFVPMGDNILLMPENKDYEPIQVSADQVSILGIAVGLIKRK